MKRALALAGTALAGWPCGAWAQASETPATSESAAPAQGAQSGVIVYPAEFFAPSSPNSALDMIQRLPGFQLDIGNVAARGLASSAGNILVDGDRPSSKNDLLVDVLRRIPAASVERIELIRGGAPGIDMQGRSVVANIVVKRQSVTEMAIETNAYLYLVDGFLDDYVGPSFRATYSHREGDKQTDFSAFATTDRTIANTARGVRTRYDSAGNTLQRADIDLWDRLRNANVRGSIQRPAGGGKLRLNALVDYFNANFRQGIDIVSGAGAGESNSSVDHRWSGEFGATWVKPLGPRTELTLIALQNLAREGYDSSSLNTSGTTTEFDTDFTSGESVFRSVLKFRPDSRWAFEGGGEIAYNFLDTASSYAQNGTRVALPNEQVRVTELRGEGFGQTTWRPSSALTVEAGLRVELSRISQSGDTDKSKSFVYPKPRLQLTWVPGKGHQFRFRAEKTVSQLDFGDFSSSTEINLGTVIGGNADLEPQKTLTLEAVYEHRFWNKGVFEVSGIHQEIEDVIDFIPLAGGFDAVGNIGHGTADAVQTRLALPLDKLGVSNALLQVRGTLQTSSVTDPLTGEKRRLGGQTRFGCGVDFTHDLDGGRFSYGLQHGCNDDVNTVYRSREVRTINYDPFVNVYVQWKPKPALTLRVDVSGVTPYHLRQRRHIYSGARDTAALLYNEHRDVRTYPAFFFQARHVL